MQFMIKAFDGENMLEKRMEVRPRHLEGMKKLGKQIICAGGLLDDEGRMKGSALVLEFPDRAALDEYLKREPYVVEGVWQKIEVERIQRLRQQAGVTVRDLQTYFGFEYPQAIYKWQHGECLPSVDNLLALARVLQVSMEDLLVYDDREVSYLLAARSNHTSCSLSLTCLSSIRATCSTPMWTCRFATCLNNVLESPFARSLRPP